MSKQGKHIDDYFLQHLGQSIVIDERDSPTSSVFRIAFGLGVMVWTDAGILRLVFCMGRPDFSKYTIGSWLILAFLFCIMLLFTCGGAFVAFARSRVEATSEKILAGNTWFGVPVKLKVLRVSEISAIKLTWERSRSAFSSRWFCAASALSAKKAKPIRLFSCSERESALELASAVAGITNLPLPLQNIPQP
jgi:hypothetical protein